MKITLLTVGKIKEAYLREGIAEYEKRLSAYAKTEIIEVKDEKTPENVSAAGRAQILKKEGERLCAHIRPDAYVVALAIEGHSPDSVELARKIESLSVHGVSHIQFVIGGSLGLSPEVLRRADYTLSFSRLTFPHRLMRLILLEQIYRSFRIISGEPYHK